MARALLASFMGRVLIILVFIGLFLGVSALVTSSGDSGSGQPCGIVASGSKLCGGDLAAYCREFADGSLDQQTVFACSSVGADVVK